MFNRPPSRRRRKLTTALRFSRTSGDGRFDMDLACLRRFATLKTNPRFAATPFRRRFQQSVRLARAIIRVGGETKGPLRWIARAIGMFT